MSDPSPPVFTRHAKKTEDPHRFLDTPNGPQPDGYRPGEPVPGEIAVYFTDDPRKLYQLRQWLPVFERLDARHPLAIITRHHRTYAELGELTGLRRVLAPTFPDLANLYESSDFKIAVYVNNSVHNFHSLRQCRLLHVHVNHGESDKVCMVSNQVKAYDRVFVAGTAAIHRHRAAGSASTRASSWRSAARSSTCRRTRAGPGRTPDDPLRTHLGGRERLQQLHLGRRARPRDRGRRAGGPAHPGPL
jgi:hypothetical protein